MVYVVNKHKKQSYDGLTICIGRPKHKDYFITSHFGNPFSHLGAHSTIRVNNRDEAIEMFRKWLLDEPIFLDKLEAFILRKQEYRRLWILEQIENLKIVNKERDIYLECFCSPNGCHGDVLKELIGEK